MIIIATSFSALATVGQLVFQLIVGVGPQGSESLVPEGSTAALVCAVLGYQPYDRNPTDQKGEGGP